MRLTVNQVEHILERWHRLRRGNKVHFGSSDPTNLTTEARREAQQYVAANSTVDTGITPRNILERIGDFQIPDPAIDYAEQKTAEYDEYIFTVCLAYGSREELRGAIKSIATDHKSGDLNLDSIDEKEVSKRLYTAQMPDPDLVIRTSGEERISNFLLWQMAYSELYFSDVFWPSFSKKELLKAIQTYQARKRRFGE